MEKTKVECVRYFFVPQIPAQRKPNLPYRPSLKNLQDGLVLSNIEDHAENKILVVIGLDAKTFHFAMKTKKYISGCLLACLVLALSLMPQLGCSGQEDPPTVTDPDPNLPRIIENPPKVTTDAEKTRIETYRLQYTQLLENNRSYLYDLLFTVSIYLAVMGACLTVVCHGLTEMKNKGPKASSKTILFILIFFAVMVSGLVIVCLYFGGEDALRRACQIDCAANQIGVEPASSQFLPLVFNLIVMAPIIVVYAWFAALLRLMMECGWTYDWNQSKWVQRVSCMVALYWIAAHFISVPICLHLLGRYWVGVPISVLIRIGIAIVPVLWFAYWFRRAVNLSRRT